MDPKMYLHLAENLCAVRAYRKPIDNEIFISMIKDTSFPNKNF